MSPGAKGHSLEPDLELLVFQIGEQRYAVPGSRLREVVAAVAMAPLPGAPAVVEGVIDLRGAVVAVVDLRQRLGLTTRALRPSDRFLLVETRRRVLALRIPDTPWLERVPTTRAEPLVVEGTRLAGVARLPDGLTLIQDIDAFLDQTESEALESALDGAQEASA